MSKSKFYIGEPVLVRLEYEDEPPGIFKGVFQGMKEGLCRVDVAGHEGHVGFTIVTAEENIMPDWEEADWGWNYDPDPWAVE